ncbi:hypothetical protein EV645_3833 [Kribbella rubisoli]|uniref:Alpha glucuronidase N-terminal domain-containing protein n=1 Tax=Kribbella rubisoli TaxID=3075929 RepID=A0A4Q7X0E8_9ACTN|nr:hypothetical protein [Kribbella rubisoli]RZU16281.1 hypothetical protein EV645_3833 [Kribbella rubisoli]
MSTVYIVSEVRSPLVDFGLAEIRTALQADGFEVVGPWPELRDDPRPEPVIVVRRVSSSDEVAAFVAGADGLSGPTYPDESFTVSGAGGRVVVEAAHPRGLLYGCLEVADLVRAQTWTEDGLDVAKSPSLSVRGVKFNLPYEPYSNGDPFRQNLETCFDLEFWRDYLDELARNRYNCLSLWSLHPFHLMVSSPEFRDANPFTDEEIADHERFFHALFGHARDRGIDVYLFTWNIYLPEPVARGLGLPAALANSSEGTETINRWDAARARQRAPQVSAYYEEMIYRLLVTYPELDGIGTSGSEAMSGTGSEKEQWVVDTYLRGIERSGRRVKFLHRTNMQSTADIIAMAKPMIDPTRFYISWKYSIAHCYSHPRPAFEDLLHVWDGVDLEQTQFLFTVRNDDVHTHRWGDVDYVREYVRGIVEKNYAHGFYWGADGYLWARDFQHVDHGHKTWRWDFERQRLQFQLWGRLAYDPDTASDVFERLARIDYGDDAPTLYEGLRHASKIIPAVNRLCWLDLDFQWHPEGCLTRDHGLRTVLDFLDSSPMPGAGTIGIREFARTELRGGADASAETPLDVIAVLTEESHAADELATEAEDRTPSWREPLATCAILDLRATAALGRYYAAKIEAALELARAEEREEPERAVRSAELLDQAVEHWKALGFFWGQHYQPYQMARVDRIFGYPFYLDDVRRDVRLAQDLGDRLSRQGEVTQ